MASFAEFRELEVLKLLNESCLGEDDLLYYVPKESLPFALTPWPLENSFDGPETFAWFTQNWSLSIYIGLIYLAVIGLLHQWMKERKPFDLSKAFFYWNVALSAFSILATLRTLPEFLGILAQEDGFHKSVCDLKTLQTPAFKSWILCFILSKIVELCDTVFLVLRKRPLTFLHVYHHFSVLIATWFTGSLIIVPPTARWYSTMNYFAHSIMYVYFAVQGLHRYRIPKFVPMTIKIVQMLQHISGIAVNLYAYNTKRDGKPCGVLNASLLSAAGIYSSFVVLFTWYFFRAYIRRIIGRRHAKAKTA